MLNYNVNSSTYLIFVGNNSTVDELTTLIASPAIIRTRYKYDDAIGDVTNISESEEIPHVNNIASRITSFPVQLMIDEMIRNERP